MRVLWFANAVNLVLCPCLIFGIGPFPELGVPGAALGTTIGRGSVGLVFLFFAPFLISIFTSDPEVAQYGVRSLRIVAAGFFFYGYGMVLTQAFNGAGDTWTPTYIALAVFWCWEIPLAWVLAHPLGLGPTGVFTAAAVGFSTLAFVSASIFRLGHWKTKKV